MESAVKALVPNVKTAAISVDTLIQQNFRYLNLILNIIKGSPSDIQNLFDIGSSVGNTALFGKTVISHTLQDLPTNTDIDLSQAGYREHGDKLILSIRAVRASGTPITIETVTFQLLKRQASIDVQETFGFVNQLTNGKPESLFHAAPSTSFIFKFPTPKMTNLDYRKFIDFGMGFNIATFNFNPNTVAEVGMGVVFSCFNVNENWKNILQGGVGYNLVGNKFYGMIGVNIPFLGFSSDIKN